MLAEITFLDVVGPIHSVNNMLRALIASRGGLGFRRAWSIAYPRRWYEVAVFVAQAERLGAPADRHASTWGQAGGLASLLDPPDPDARNERKPHHYAGVRARPDTYSNVLQQHDAQKAEPNYFFRTHTYKRRHNHHSPLAILYTDLFTRGGDHGSLTYTCSHIRGGISEPRSHRTITATRGCPFVLMPLLAQVTSA